MAKGKLILWMKILSIWSLVSVLFEVIDLQRIGWQVTGTDFAVILLSIIAIIISFKK